MEDKYGQHLTIMSDGKLYAEIVTFVCKCLKIFLIKQVNELL